MAAGGSICSVGVEEETGDTAIALPEHLVGAGPAGVANGLDRLHTGAGTPTRASWIV